jgi:sulfofructose kinase
VGVGANAVDYVNLLPACPQPSGPLSKVRIRRQIVSCGGQTATAMATCASLGLRAKYIGVLGADENGRRIGEELARRHVDTVHAVVRATGNAFAVILVDESCGERIVLWHRGDALCLRDEELQPDVLRSARIVHVDDVDEHAAIAAARIARQAGVVVTSDIDRATDATDELIAAVTYPIFAEHVPTGMTGTADVEQALRRLRARFPHVLCVTLGSAGAIALDGDAIVREPSFDVDAIDTTGAGDVFRGAFIYARLNGDDVRQTLRFANAAAAASCRRTGAMAGVPSLDETRELLASGSFRTGHPLR